jgi:hypothetical protein
MEQDLDVFKMI